MKYARCKIKNIAIPIPKLGQSDNNPPSKWIEEINTLPNDCIRIKSNAGWCIYVCKECIGVDIE